MEAEPQDAEEASFKKRYGDLRRHATVDAAKGSRDCAKVQKQLETAAKGQIKFPKTDEEIEQWSKKYPDVAKIVDTIAQKRANEVTASKEWREASRSLEQIETKLTRK